LSYIFSEKDCIIIFHSRSNGERVMHLSLNVFCNSLWQYVNYLS